MFDLDDCGVENVNQQLVWFVGGSTIGPKKHVGKHKGQEIQSPKHVWQAEPYTHKKNLHTLKKQTNLFPISFTLKEQTNLFPISFITQVMAMEFKEWVHYIYGPKDTSEEQNTDITNGGDLDL